MKHFYYIIFIASLFCISCGNNKTAQLEQERDSLLTVTQNQGAVLQNMTSTVAGISASLDSIALQEQMLLQKNDERGNPMTENVIKGKLDNLANTLKAQRDKLSSMEASLKGNQKEIAQLKKIVTFLNAELAKKNEEVLALRADLENKKVDISKLHSRVRSLSQDMEGANKRINDQSEQIAQKEEKIAKQDASLNEVYYIIGTKKELAAKGLINTGWLKKTTVNYSSIDKSGLQKADKRNLTTITITGKSPKIISNVPQGTYTLNDNILTITDKNKFWSANNRILVIQIK